MLGSRTPAIEQTPRRTPVQGHREDEEEHNSSLRSLSQPRNSSCTSTAVNNEHGETTASPTATSNATGTPSRQQGPARPSAELTVALNHQSPSLLHQTISEAGDGDDEPFPSPASKYSLDALRKQRARMSLTGDRRNNAAESNSQVRTGAWYMRRNQPTTETPPNEHTSSVLDATPTKMRSSSAVAASPTSTVMRSKMGSPSSASASRFSFFSMPTLKNTKSTAVAVPKDDELINLDIDSALFPAGVPSEGEAFSPAAFKNLQMNATGLLRKFQTAYQGKAIACQELRAERDAQEDEKIEIQTRTHHLKMQLEGMAQRAAETEAMMHALMEELHREKLLRAEEKTARESGVMSSGMSTISEDLGAEDDQRHHNRRRSDGTARSDDASSDTDGESADDFSVFSRSRSPTLAASISDMSPVESNHSPVSSQLPPLPRIPATQITKALTLEPPLTARPSQPPQMSTFQKLFKGISGDGKDSSAAAGTVSGCSNCEGQDASVAWDTASLLRDENRGLKQRVSELESAVEDAIDAVMGVKLY